MNALSEETKQLTALGEGIVLLIHTIDKTGMPQYFKSERGRD